MRIIMHTHSNSVKSRIRTGIAIPSFVHCLEELVTNSLDAKATSVSILIDMTTITITVTDNGCGFTNENLSVAGSRYATSKCHNVKDVEQNLCHYGYRGEALCSIAEISRTLRIATTCRERSGVSCMTISNFGADRSVVTRDDVFANTGHGTTITAIGLFSNNALHHSQCSPVSLISRMQRKMCELCLPHFFVSFTLRDKHEGKIFYAQKVNDLYSRICDLFGSMYPTSCLELATASESELTLSTHYGKSGHSDKSIQFVYVNDRLVLKTRIHIAMQKLVSGVIRMNGRCSAEVSFHEPISNPQSCANNYPVFVLLIKCPRSWYDICLDPSKTKIEFSNWDLVLSTVRNLFEPRRTSAPTSFRVSTRKNSGEEVGEMVKLKLETDVALDSLFLFGKWASSSKRIGSKSQSYKSQDPLESNASPDEADRQTASTSMYSLTDKPMESKKDLALPLQRPSISRDETSELNLANGSCRSLLLPGRSPWISKFDCNLGKIVHVNTTTGRVALGERTFNESRIVKPKAFSADKHKFNFPLSGFHGKKSKLVSERAASALELLSSDKYGGKKELVFRAPLQATTLTAVPSSSSDILNSVKVPTDVLRHIQVIGQVDNKFILCLTRCGGQLDELLLLFDQHAVHERVRLEKLVRNAYEDPSSKKVRSTILQNGLVLRLDVLERRAVTDHPEAFTDSGLHLRLVPGGVYVTGIPTILHTEVEEKSTRSQRSLRSIIGQLMHERTEFLQTTGTSGSTMSPILFDHLCSKACHGAIKFGENLSLTKCTDLLNELAHCKLPFQCAHGRPSLFPLLHLNQVDRLEQKPTSFKHFNVKKCSKNTARE